MSATCCSFPGTPWLEKEKRATKKRVSRRKKQEKKRKRLADQAHANKAAGSRFERAVVAAFRMRGLHAARVDESSGHIRGWDIFVEQFPDMVVQCKATSTKAALLNGLEEARKLNPNRLFWVCFHSYRQKGKRAEIRVAYSSRVEGPPSITDSDGFFHVLMKALAEGEEYPDA